MNGWDKADLQTLLVQDKDYFRGPPPPPWNEVLDEWGVQAAIVPVDARLNPRLSSAGWVRVWEDYAFNIWVRNTPQNQPVIEKAKALPQPARILNVIQWY